MMEDERIVLSTSSTSLSLGVDLWQHLFGGRVVYRLLKRRQSSNAAVQHMIGELASDLAGRRGMPVLVVRLAGCVNKRLPASLLFPFHPAPHAS